MGSAFRSFLPELLSTGQARAARRGRAFLVLDAATSIALFSNAAGAKAFGVPSGGPLPAILVRQIRSSARVLAERGAAALLLRVPAGRSSRPVAATATRLGDGGESILLLVAENSEAAADAESGRLLAGLGLAPDEAAVLDSSGALLEGTGPVSALAAHLAGFVAGDDAAKAIVVEGRAIRLFRVEDDRILALAEAASTGGGERRSTVAKPTRLRSAWGPAPAVVEASAEPGSACRVPREESRAEGATEPAPAATRFVAHLDAAPVRFVWQIGADGRFRSFSPEFAATVGSRSAEVVGRTFTEVAEDLGFDETGAIRRLLDRRDTWSGRTVFWPVENTDRRVPIDLAALPIYSRDRAFDGFRGFGIIRVADHEADPRGRGLRSGFPAAAEVAEPDRGADTVPGEAAEDEAVEPTRSRPVFRTFEADLPGVSFGRREAPPARAAAAAGEADKVVRLPPDRRRHSEATLSEAEKAAFREIGVKLGQHQAEAETPGALRFEAPAPEPRQIEATRAEPRPEPPVLAETTARAAVEATASAPAAIGITAGDEASPDIRAVLARLPLPAIVQGLDALVFANRAFLDFAGYEDIDSLNRAGGLDALFAERAMDDAETHALTVRRADGEAVEAAVRMQRIAFAGRSSLLMTFEQDAQPVVAPRGDEADDLRRELAEMKAVLDIATDGVVLIDRQGVVRAANGSAQALFGMAEAEFRGRPVSDIFAHESRKVVADYFETLKTKGLAGIMNDGREVIGRVAQGGFVPLFITAGRVSEERGWCVVIRDMSHWKRIEEELLNAKRSAEAASLHKSRFLANISHELRTPLNAIIGFADVMASECFGPIGSERYIEYLGDIKRSGHHVLDLVNDLLDISKIEAGRMELTFESVSLNEVLTEVVSTMQPQANRERVIVRSNLPASVPPVVADRRTIRQIALNLLSNSVRFTPAGGQIIASTTYTADGSVLLRVRDSGIGMTASEIEMALTPFQQVQKPGDVRNGGTGLGLPLTKAMAEANRADFSIRSTPGEGTLVEIAFPAPRVLLD